MQAGTVRSGARRRVWTAAHCELSARPASAIELALRQGFVVTRRQVRELGLSDAELRRRVRGQRGEPAQRGPAARFADDRDAESSDPDRP